MAGGPARQLTSDKASDTQPTVSPDGKWIAFVSKRGDDTENQIYVIAVDGGEARRVTNMPDRRLGAEVVSGQHAARVRERSVAGPRALGRPGRAQEGARGFEDDARASGRKRPSPTSITTSTIASRICFRSRSTAASPTAITRMSGYHLSKQEYDAFSYDISPDGLEVAFAADVDKTGIDSNYDIILLDDLRLQAAAQHFRGQQGR